MKRSALNSTLGWYSAFRADPLRIQHLTVGDHQV
jgi:hypothetical protein